MSETKFVKDMKFGTSGEDRVFNYLRHHNQTKMIMDVTKDEQYQKDDVDFLVQIVGDKIFRIEVKTDSQTDVSGNIVYETMSNNNKGCLARSKADLVYYVTQNNMYCFLLSNVRLFIANRKPKEISMGDNAKGYLLSVKDLLNGGYMQKVEEDKWNC